MAKILILANFDVGLYKFRKDLIQTLIQQKNSVFISLPDGEFVKPLKEMGCHFVETAVDRRGINPVTDLSLMLQYRRMFKQIKPDLVITYTIKPNIYGGLICRIMKIPYVVNITGLGTAFEREGWIKKLVIFLYRISGKCAKTIFFENVGNKKVFERYDLVQKGQAKVLPGAGIRLDEYPFSSYPTDGPIHFLFIGRVMKEKGMDELFYAAKQIKKKYPQVVFDIVGPYEDDYKEQVEQLQADGIIQYHGFQEDVKPWIQNCQCFVLPSYHEGMANTLLEAGAMGRPLLTSRIHGCMEAVEDKESGYLVSAKDADDLEEKLEMFIKLSSSEKEKMGAKSHQVIAKKFDKREVVEMTVKELSRCLKYQL